SRGRCIGAVTAQALHLVEGGRILGAVESRRRGNSELVGRHEDERPDLAPVRSQREGELADRVLAPLSRLVTRDEIDPDAWLGLVGAVVTPEREDRGGRLTPEIRPISSRTGITDGGEVLLESRVEARRLRGEERDEGIVCRLGNRGFHGCARG